ncbi:MAG: VRR-NUC domain-containing protein, partial [Byssovorax sp.]
GGAFLRVGPGGVTTAAGYSEIHPGGPGSGDGSAPSAPETPGKGGIEAIAFRPRARLPLLGFPGLPPMAPTLGGDPEKPVICDAMCFCKNIRDLPDGTRGTNGPNRQQCVAARLWAYDKALGNQSTIKAEVPYDMSQNPPTPIMSQNDPTRPTHKRRLGSKIPDVVLVKDPTRPPTQDNIRKIIEMKFDNDPEDPEQIRIFEKIAGPGIPVEIWTTTTCGCGKEETERVPVPETHAEPERKHDGEVLFLVLAILVLLADDAVPGGFSDDPAIVPLLARLRMILAK